MFNRLNLFEICRDGMSAIKSGCGRWSFFVVYFLSPLLIAGFLCYFNITIPQSISSDIIGGIGLFAGLMFTLLFVITNSYRARKEQFSSTASEESIQYLRRYSMFAQSVVALVSYSIVKAGATILFTLIYISLPSPKDDEDLIVIVKQICGVFLFVQLLQFAMIITMVLKEMYAMLFDDLNS